MKSDKPIAHVWLTRRGPSPSVTMRPDEHPSLLPPGFHDVTRQDLYDRFVDAFDAGFDHRDTLWERFEAFLDALESVGIGYEVWIDGSFTTECLTPADVDVVVCLERDAVNALSDAAAETLQDLFHEAFKPEVKERYRTDAYLVFNDQDTAQATWEDHFGTYRDNETEKGIARLTKQAP